MTPEKAWSEACQIVGGPAKMARAIGVSRQRLSQWTVCKAEFVLAAETAIHAAMARIRRGITRFDLRPDLYRRK